VVSHTKPLQCATLKTTNRLRTKEMSSKCTAADISPGTNKAMGTGTSTS